MQDFLKITLVRKFPVNKDYDYLYVQSELPLTVSAASKWLEGE
jgi:hypothetical protein